MRKILVTGGCGFIGSHFVRRLLNEFDDLFVVNLDRLTYAGNPRNLGEYRDHSRHELIEGDLADADAVRRVLQKDVSEIVHLAAESHVDRSIVSSTDFVRTNVVGTQVLLDAAREFKIARFIHVSTDEVYGSLAPGEFATESSPLAPNNPYAASKAAADMLVRSYCHTYGLPAIVTRCSNNYGPRQYPEKLIPLFIARLMQDQPVPLYGDGEHERDWIHVDDHCAAIDAVRSRGRVGEVYNIGSGRPMANIDLTRRLLAILGKPERLIQHSADRPGHDRRYAIDCGKLKNELGWAPEIEFDPGLRETVQWYQDNADWFVK